MVARAHELGVIGWVRNRRDGTVEALVDGETAAVEELLRAPTGSEGGDLRDSRHPASEFTRNFGRYQMLAQREPVAVTSHGRTTGSFVAAEEFEEFARYKESRRSFSTVDLSDEKAAAISSARMDPRHAHLDAMPDE